jgi:hypothetical protein
MTTEKNNSNGGNGMNIKTVKIKKQNGSIITRHFCANNPDILHSCDRDFSAVKIVISGREYCKTGAGYVFTGRG